MLSPSGNLLIANLLRIDPQSIKRHLGRGAIQAGSLSVTAGSWAASWSGDRQLPGRIDFCTLPERLLDTERLLAVGVRFTIGRGR